MKKFKIYGVLISTALLLYAIELFTPFGLISLSLNQIISVIALLLVAALYIFLLSVLNYFKEPTWKKLAVIILLINQYVPVVLLIMHALSKVSYHIISVCLNIPFFFAFISIKHTGISKLANACAYTILLISIVYLVIELTKFNITPYNTLYKATALIPGIIAIYMCYKMVEISSYQNERTSIADGQVDLLDEQLDV